MLETRSRSQAKALAEHRAGTISHSRGSGQFENELAKATRAPEDPAKYPNERQRDDQTPREHVERRESMTPKQRDEAKYEAASTRKSERRSDEMTAKSDRSENLWSQSGAGTEGRLGAENRTRSEGPSLNESAEGGEIEPSDELEAKSSVASLPRRGTQEEEVSHAARGARTALRSSDDDSALEDDEEASETVIGDGGMHLMHSNHLDSHEAKAPPTEVGASKLVQIAGGTGASQASGPTEAAVTPRQKAMLELLEKMQQEIGVSPEKILQAFNELDEASLKAAPDQSMKSFVAKLSADSKLSPHQTLRASSLYGKFLGDVAQADFDETLDGLAKTQALQDGSLGEAALGKLNQSVEDLQRTLKNVGQTPEQLQAEVARLVQLSQSMKSTKMDAKDGAGLLMGDDDGSDLNELSGKDLENLRGAGDKNLGLGLGGLLTGQDASSVAFGQSPGSFSGQNGNPQSGQGSGAGHQAPKLSSTSARNSLRAEIDQAIKGLSGPGRAGPTGEADSAQAVSGQMVAAKTGPVAGATIGATAGAEASLLRTPMSSKDEEANVKELMKQAQLIVKKGGGEMKLEMSPEGVGKVHLKVGVENGQVSVQMLAESDAAKKMLENNLQDLRASLVAHKLHVDQLKVDTTKVDGGADIKKQMDQQAQGDAGREQARQMARDFMSEFRDDREGFRQGFFDHTPRGYKKSVARIEVRPDAVSAMSARRAGAAGRLNVMA